MFAKKERKKERKRTDVADKETNVNVRLIVIENERKKERKFLWKERENKKENIPKEKLSNAKNCKERVMR